MNQQKIDECSVVSEKLTVAVSECGRRFEITNPQREKVATVKVDGCLINDERQRCDYLFEIGKVCHCAIYVELKGKDVEKAYRQLAATLGYLSNHHKACNKMCYIVASRVPRAGVAVQKLKLQMARDHKVLLFVATNQISINAPDKE